MTLVLVSATKVKACFSGSSFVYLLTFPLFSSSAAAGGKVPPSPVVHMILLLTNDSPVTQLNLEAVFHEGNTHCIMAIFFLLTCRQRGKCLFFLMKAEALGII